MILRPPRSTRTDTLFPYTTLFRSDRNIRSCGGLRRITMLEVADRPVDTASDASHGSPAALNAVNHWVPHNIVMRDTWFPLAHSSSIGQKPVRRAIYSHPYFIWRETRSEARRVGKECVRTCRSRGSPDH